MKKRHPIIRFFAHLISNPWQVRRHLPHAALHHIEQAITQSERTHTAEIRFVVEAGLHPYEIVFGKSPRKRAIELFSRLNIWDTEQNNGVLLYLLLADKDVEIVADRGINQHVGYENWDKICREMENMFKQGQFEAGVLQGIADISAYLQQHFSPQTPKPQKRKNELPDKPLVL